MPIRLIRLLRIKMAKRPKDPRKFAKMIIKFECVDGDLVRTRDNALRATDQLIDSMCSRA